MPETIEDIIRRIVREELAAAPARQVPTQPTIPGPYPWPTVPVPYDGGTGLPPVLPPYIITG